jgi:hypothetical protein
MVFDAAAAGLSKPVGEQAVGWRVAVYWKADKVFYQASIRAFDPASGQYCLAYAKGDQEHLHLGKQCLKWCPAPEASKYSHVIPPLLPTRPVQCFYSFF